MNGCGNNLVSCELKKSTRCEGCAAFLKRAKRKNQVCAFNVLDAKALAAFYSKNKDIIYTVAECMREQEIIDGDLIKGPRVFVNKVKLEDIDER